MPNYYTGPITSPTPEGLRVNIAKGEYSTGSIFDSNAGVLVCPPKGK